MKIDIKKTKKPKGISDKAKIIIIFPDGVTIHGDGHVEGIKNHILKQAVFTCTLVKDL